MVELTPEQATFHPQPPHLPAVGPPPFPSLLVDSHRPHCTPAPPVPTHYLPFWNRRATCRVCCGHGWFTTSGGSPANTYRCWLPFHATACSTRHLHYNNALSMPAPFTRDMRTTASAAYATPHTTTPPPHLHCWFVPLPHTPTTPRAAAVTVTTLPQTGANSHTQLLCSTVPALRNI